MPIKNNIFSYYLNLELIEEYVVNEGYNFEDQIRSAKITIDNINKAIKEAEKVANTEYRQLYKLLHGLGKEDIKNILEYVLNECYDFLCNKYYLLSIRNFQVSNYAKYSLMFRLSYKKQCPLNYDSFIILS